MPVDPGTTLPIFQGMLASNGLLGPGTVQLANGLSSGLCQYMSAAIVVLSIDAGTLGTGTGLGVGIIIPQFTILGAVGPIMTGHGIFGPMAAPLANAIASGVSISLAGAMIQTVNAGVGVGTGKVQLVPTGAGGTVFSAALVAAGLVGMMAPALGDAIGMALDSVIASAIGVVAIVGPTSPLPGTGVGTGSIV